MKGFVLFLFAVVQLSSAQSGGNETPADPNLDWTKTFDFAPNSTVAAQQAADTGKPILVIMHMTRCKACKTLIKKLNDDPLVKAMAKNFIVVHSQDKSDPVLDAIQPDTKGSYFPRLVFLKSPKQIFTSVTSPHSDYRWDIIFDR